MESGAGCHNCGQKTVSCLLFVGPETYKLSGRGGSGRAMQGLGPGNKSEGVAAEERRGVAATGSSCHTAAGQVTPGH